MLATLREHGAFRRLWLGTTVSTLGSAFGGFAVTFHVWDRTQSAAAVGLIGLFTAAPLIVLALVGGAFADRFDRRRLIMAVTCGQIVTSGLMAVVALGEAVWPMFVLAGVASGLSGLGAPAKRALIPGLLPPSGLAVGLALNHFSFQLAMLLGPALAGLVTARWGTAACLMVDAITFVAAVAALASLPASGAGPVARRATQIWEGLRFAAREPAVRGALLADLAATVLAMPMALFPVINHDRFGGSPQTLGLFTTAVAVGGVLASVLSRVIIGRRRPGLILLMCASVWGGALAGVGLSRDLVIVLALLAVAGAADTWSVVSRGTVVQSCTPESHRGRIAALEHIVGVAGPELGSLRGGLLASVTSGPAAMVAGGLSCVVGIGLLALSAPRLRQFEVRPTGLDMLPEVVAPQQV